jgi:hypothetical protein
MRSIVHLALRERRVIGTVATPIPMINDHITNPTAPGNLIHKNSFLVETGETGETPALMAAERP